MKESSEKNCELHVSIKAQTDYIGGIEHIIRKKNHLDYIASLLLWSAIKFYLKFMYIQEKERMNTKLWTFDMTKFHVCKYKYDNF